VLILAGTYLAFSGDRGIAALIAVLLAFAGVLRQMIVATQFWELSVSD
jgi:hypothetical protein